MASYGADKLNDPAKAEPVVQQMIQLEPGEPTNYFALAKIYEDAGVYDEAEKMLRDGEERQAERPGGLHDARRLLQPPGPVRQDDRGARGARGEGAEQPRGVLHDRHLLLGRGLPRLHAEGRARRRTSSARASRRSTRRCSSSRTTSRRIVYKGLLLRLQANLEKDPAKQQALLKEADRAQRQGERAAQGEGRRHRALEATEM